MLLKSSFGHSCSPAFKRPQTAAGAYLVRTIVSQTLNGSVGPKPRDCRRSLAKSNLSVRASALRTKSASAFCTSARFVDRIFQASRNWHASSSPSLGRTLRLCLASQSGDGAYFVPRFSYHFKFAVDVPMHAISARPSPLISPTAQPAPAIPPSSSTLFTHCFPSLRYRFTLAPRPR
jgi:hypothetical protein